MNVGLAQELSDTGITVNLVSPGLIRTTEVEQAFLTKAVKAGWGDTFEAAETMIVKEYAPNPLGRMATREEIADVVVFVCSQRASFINGQNIRVDGGALGIVQ
jgi:NAD(P)-dependent dehydrogenase (short-subunit alcohol dehydrogenase family)